jgi:transcription initiation factor TFIIH subunit 2
MADSDGDYVEDVSDEDEIHPVPLAKEVASNYGTRSKGAASQNNEPKKNPQERKQQRRRAAWEDIQRSWEDVIRDEKEGKKAFTFEQLVEEEKRRRLLRDTTPLQRGIIRHLMLVLDLSSAMTEKDLLPTRYHLTLHYTIEFVLKYFEENPISQLGIIGMRDGVAVRISDMSGNPAEHIERLRVWLEKQEPSGVPSLQNALEMCRGALLYVSTLLVSVRVRAN